MPLLSGPEVHTNISDKGIPRESPIPGNVTHVLYMGWCINCFVTVYICAVEWKWKIIILTKLTKNASYLNNKILKFKHLMFDCGDIT